MGGVEYGKCNVCKKEAPLSRKYFHYGLYYESNQSELFTYVSHCSKCEPKEPEVVRLDISTKKLKEGTAISTKLAIQSLKHSLKTLPEYRRAWKANIAMAIVDEVNLARQLQKDNVSFKDIPDIANKAADRFLDNLIQ